MLMTQQFGCTLPVTSLLRTHTHYKGSSSNAYFTHISSHLNTYPTHFIHSSTYSTMSDQQQQGQGQEDYADKGTFCAHHQSCLDRLSLYVLV